MKQQHIDGTGLCGREISEDVPCLAEEYDFAKCYGDNWNECSSCPIPQFVEGVVDLNCTEFYEVSCSSAECCPPCSVESDAYVKCIAGMPADQRPGPGDSFFKVDDFSCFNEDCSGSDAPSSRPTTSPSIAPSSAPPPRGSTRTVAVKDISTRMVNVGLLTEEEIVKWKKVTKKWFESFFKKGGNRKRRRSLQRQRDAREITTEIEFVSQEVTVDDDGVSSNEIVYNQQITYTTDPHEDDKTSEGDTDFESLSAEEIAALPYQESSSNTQLALELAQNIDSFENVQFPIEVPDVPAQDDGGGLSISIVIAIVLLAVGGIVLVAVSTSYLRFSRLKGGQPMGRWTKDSLEEQPMEKPGVMRWEG